MAKNSCAEICSRQDSLKIQRRSAGRGPGMVKKRDEAVRKSNIPQEQEEPDEKSKKRRRWKVEVKKGE